MPQDEYFVPEIKQRVNHKYEIDNMSEAVIDKFISNTLIFDNEFRYIFF